MLSVVIPNFVMLCAVAPFELNFSVFLIEKVFDRKAFSMSWRFYAILVAFCQKCIHLLLLETFAD